ncbi:hypothetical protein A0J61_10118 [Choanephora cucurbitarum]|uniref:Uncharacterized protein n=1 Tax=Choanephora cucurbitarum TaxID=101091 RepID=A0A1C7MYE4_9FUNG|nr:hypothetical protein A0J61_10118 [Choanephora cucurbitarum]
MNSVYSKVLPLTFENLSKISRVDDSYTPLARFCNEVGTDIIGLAESNTSISARRLMRPHEVVESPHLMSFPFHNDSRFLPTAEHDYPGGNSDTSSLLFNSSVYTRQRLNSATSYTTQSILGQAATYRRNCRMNRADDVSSLFSHRRRYTGVTPSSLSTLRDDETMVSQKKRQSTCKLTFKLKQGLSKNSNISEHNYTETVKKTSWFKKLWKLMRPKPATPKKTISEPVWYSQFRCNPPPPTAFTS